MFSLILGPLHNVSQWINKCLFGTVTCGTNHYFVLIANFLCPALLLFFVNVKLPCVLQEQTNATENKYPAKVSKELAEAEKEAKEWQKKCLPKFGMLLFGSVLLLLFRTAALGWMDYNSFFDGKIEGHAHLFCHQTNATEFDCVVDIVPKKTNACNLYNDNKEYSHCGKTCNPHL